MKNRKIKEKLKEYGMAQWELADFLGIHENTLYRKLRHEMSDEEQTTIIELIEKRGMCNANNVNH